MIFVLPIFIVGGFVLIALWWFFFRVTVRHESTIRAAKVRASNFDRLLATPGEALYCLECRMVFPGPLEDHGCPQCHTRAFVIPARTRPDPSAAAPVAEAQATGQGRASTPPPAPDDTLQLRSNQRKE